MFKYKASNGYSHSSFNNEFYEFWQCYQSNEFIQKTKYYLFEIIQELFRDIFPYAGLYIIGSTVNGFGQSMSQLDICLMISHEILTDFESGLILQKIRNIFQKGTYFRNVKLLKKTYSILTFSDLITSITCNIYLNEISMIRNTYLMRFYAECDHRLPILVHTIKIWALKVHLKERIDENFNGYCLTLMCIYFLQVDFSSSPIAPRYHEFLSKEKFHKNLDIRTLNLSTTIDLAKLWISTNLTLDIGDLFLRFLKFYANEFDFKNHIISIRTGRKLPKHSTIHANHRYIVIEEPLTGTNLTSNIISDSIFSEFLSIFRTSFEILSSTYHLPSLFIN